MQTQTPPSPGTETRSRSMWTTVALVVIVVAVGFGVWAVVALTGQDDLEVATERVDEWVAGWNEEDPDKIAAVFIDDAQYTNPTGTESFTGRDEIRGHATEYREFILNARRVADGVVTENDRFVFRIDFDAEATSYSGEIEVELREDLIARMVWIKYEEVN